MAASAPVRQNEQIRLLGEVCARNTPAELHLQSGEADLVTAKVRLLRVDAKQVYVDQPQSPGKQIQVQAGQPVIVYFLVGSTRYTFRTRVVRTHCSIELNARQRVAGMTLAIPEKIREQQRRADFRLSLAGQSRTVASMHRMEAQQPDRCPVDARRFSARLVNVSAGGIGVLIDSSELRDAQAGDVFCVSFSLSEEEEFCMLAELRHCRRSHDKLLTAAGLIFLPWSLVPLRPCVRRIARVLVAKQRKQLRRGR